MTRRDSQGRWSWGRLTLESLLFTASPLPIAPPQKRSSYVPIEGETATSLDPKTVGGTALHPILRTLSPQEWPESQSLSVCRPLAIHRVCPQEPYEVGAILSRTFKIRELRVSVLAALCPPPRAILHLPLRPGRLTPAELAQCPRPLSFQLHSAGGWHPR